MNVYVMADIEGISGIYCSEQVCPTNSRFTEGRRYLTDDINACVAGLKAGGADKVYVCDCHGGSYSLEWANASSDADGYVCGKVGDTRYAGLAACDAVVLLGYHAMAGTKAAILEHTYSSAEVQNLYINDVKVGEIAVDAAIAGEQGKPVIMVVRIAMSGISSRSFVSRSVISFRLVFRPMRDKIRSLACWIGISM